MILEAIVTTLNADGTLNVAPMGPQISDSGMQQFALKPFDTSTTLLNLKQEGEGVLHVTDDVLLFAKAAIGSPVELETRAANKVRGQIISNTCRWYEFKVKHVDETASRAHLNCETVDQGRNRDFFGFNRAKHSVIEAAILATRVSFLPSEQIQNQFAELNAIIQKTGGSEEVQAFELLLSYVNQAVSR